MPRSRPTRNSASDSLSADAQILGHSHPEWQSEYTWDKVDGA
jgi:hypothetical protein